MRKVRRLENIVSWLLIRKGWEWYTYQQPVSPYSRWVNGIRVRVDFGIDSPLCAASPPRESLSLGHGTIEYPRGGLFLPHPTQPISLHRIPLFQNLHYPPLDQVGWRPLIQSPTSLLIRRESFLFQALAPIVGLTHSSLPREAGVGSSGLAGETKGGY